ncbi:hypothetical protein JCM30760_17970 [Thiomicrorhabdus hydrogeniphila]
MTDTVEETIKTQPLQELLVQAREKKNMALAEAAKKLNLSVKQLEKFETSDLDLKNLTPFERGYLRNYAFLLNVDMKEFEDQFPAGMSIGSDLQTIHHDKFQTRKPFKISGWIKLLFIVLLIALVIWIASTLGIDFSKTDIGKTLEKVTEISLPNPTE